MTTRIQRSQQEIRDRNVVRKKGGALSPGNGLFCTRRVGPRRQILFVKQPLYAGARQYQIERHMLLLSTAFGVQTVSCFRGTDSR